ncbi:MAG: hypothetical protein ISR57_06115 [Bacteroidales bacterium]|nr:hypothetical protein [Bacteroidota bacterium]MBL6950203.1 hypothetical protein [Bacteroidales bacterium]
MKKVLLILLCLTLYSTVVCSQFDADSWEVFTPGRLGTDGALQLFEDSKGNVWFGLGLGLGQRAGIGKFDGTEWTFFDKDTGLPKNLIVSILEDSKGNMWFGIPSGIVRYSP